VGLDAVVIVQKEEELSRGRARGDVTARAEIAGDRLPEE